MALFVNQQRALLQGLADKPRLLNLRRIVHMQLLKIHGRFQLILLHRNCTTPGLRIVIHLIIGVRIHHNIILCHIDAKIHHRKLYPVIFVYRSQKLPGFAAVPASGKRPPGSWILIRTVKVCVIVAPRRIQRFHIIGIQFNIKTI